MKILEADCWCPSKEVVNRAVEIIRRGGLVVGPTDTLYGIFADPFNPKALERVYKVKGRTPDKPLPLLLGESHHAFLVVEPTALFWKLALKHWPGPLTIIASPTKNLPDHLRAWGNIGVRLPNCPLAREIARKVGGVIVGTSANKSGRTAPITVYESTAQLGEKIDLYIDGGPAYHGKPSTVVDATGVEPDVFREGVILEKDL